MKKSGFWNCLYHGRPYSAAAQMLADSAGFVPQENAHTSTAQIMTSIMQTEDDAAFMRYLSAHCYNNEQQFQRAREIILCRLCGLHRAGLPDGVFGRIGGDEFLAFAEGMTRGSDAAGRE